MRCGRLKLSSSRAPAASLRRPSASCRFTGRVRVRTVRVMTPLGQPPPRAADRDRRPRREPARDERQIARARAGGAPRRADRPGDRREGLARPSQFSSASLPMTSGAPGRIAADGCRRSPAGAGNPSASRSALTASRPEQSSSIAVVGRCPARRAGSAGWCRRSRPAGGRRRSRRRPGAPRRSPLVAVVGDRGVEARGAGRRARPGRRGRRCCRCPGRRRTRRSRRRRTGRRGRGRRRTARGSVIAG